MQQRLLKLAHLSKTKMTRHSALQPTSMRAFSTKTRDEMHLNAKWSELAQKELRGKDVKQTLVRETNE